MDLRALLLSHAPTAGATVAAIIALQVLIGKKSIVEAIRSLLPFPSSPSVPSPNDLVPPGGDSGLSLPGGFIFDDPLDVVRYLSRLVLKKLLPDTPQWQEVIDLIEQLLEKLAKHETASARYEVDPGVEATVATLNRAVLKPKDDQPIRYATIRGMKPDTKAPPK